METIEERVERLEFYNELTVKSIDLSAYPFYALIMENKLTEEEMQETEELCTRLAKKYEVMQEEGFVHYTALLIEFAGMLTPKLKPRQAIMALRDQDLFLPLMKKLYELSLTYE
ncbi:DUF1878 family protein [Fictibacillus aquaticus]|uniref:DUF1878 domain-containing protein n=1 Tax=Fictibacillus aquaticus TaxID=2021314 RepID=A0A235F6H5_9BACL|nr:DUF1878 family protein [Fictibacillus aquaticus]OYD56829.1 hypothetical protein CGZ90_14840 [Fictibacillus aquaticus]